MAPKKKKTAKRKSDDVDPKILRKIKEPKIEPIEDLDDEPEEIIVIDDEKPVEPEEESF